MIRRNKKSVRRIMHSVWPCCVENVNTIRLLRMMRWSGHKSGNVCDVVMLSTIYWYILSEYDGFGNLMCRFDEIQHFFHLGSCCILVASLRVCVLACLADLPPASACGQAHATYHRLRCEHSDTWVGRIPQPASSVRISWRSRLSIDICRRVFSCSHNKGWSPQNLREWGFPIHRAGFAFTIKVRANCLVR